MPEPVATVPLERDPLREPTAPDAAPTIDAAQLLRGGNEAFIRHAGQTYRLLLTRANKLLLTK